MNFKTPVFDTPKEGCSTVEILKILLGETRLSKLCITKLCSVGICASFVVDLVHVSLRDIHADDNGSWTAYARVLL